ncbi:hypothetical protein F5Y15DRAFT_139638 [Xylariaceae sp. FL0016]|nr:hypothetical protein F5Y15DRAFT_139638 [Xylariaceae sp. FL0016]
MSLNGLDAANVKEAHEVASAEPGGWFLLKYASRDGVELLDSGTGGIVDTRNAIAKYEEPSPLYGFLKYRRRNVIVKYMPEDCSRLIQARAAVHFNAVCEHFTPYSTTFEITVAKDLKDSKLSAACSLHAASGSSSSSTSSLRRRRLNEIAEEEEEEERERKRQSIVKEEERPTSSMYSDPPRSPLSPEPLAILDPKQITAPQDTNFASTTGIPEFSGAERPNSPTKFEADRRMSSQSARPELYSYATYTYGKPKVKLGPRPSLDNNKRPSTAGNFRPVAALPAGFKFFKGSKKGKQEQENGELEESDTISPASIPIPEEPQESAESVLPPRPATSSGASIKSLTPSMATSTKEGKMTPEKARLMKAMKLREKKKLMSIMPSEPLPSSRSPPIAEEKESTVQSDVHGEDNTQSASNVDSGVDLPTPVTISTEPHSDDTATESHPPSPTAASSSEIGDSTKASSLSESTDETVQATKEDVRREEEGDDTEDGPDELSEIVEEAGLRMSAVEAENRRSLSPKLVQEPQAETEDMHVSDDAVLQEPERTTDFQVAPLTTAELKIQESIEVDDIIPKEESLIIETREVQVPSHQSDETTSPPLGVPISRFSSNEQKSSISPKSPTTPSLKSKFSRTDLTIPTESVPAIPDSASATEKVESHRPESPADAPPELRLPPKSHRRKPGSMDPIRTDLTAKSTPQSEIIDPLLDDDDLMDELQSATVQEARPITVSKSPITPVFPPSPQKQHIRLARAVTSPMRSPAFLAPGDVSQSSARSVSSGGAAYLHTITRQNSNAGLQSKKTNLGSGISQRIKALEALSGGPNSTGEESRPRTAAPTSNFFTVRRPGTRDSSKSKSPSMFDRASSLTRQSPTPERSRERTPEMKPEVGRRERSGSVASKLTMFEGQTTTRGRPESIQVTARIVRDTSNPFVKNTEISKGTADTAPTELRQSPLVVDVQRAEAVPAVTSEPRSPPETELPKQTIQERRELKSIAESGDKSAKRRSSLSIMRDFIKDSITHNKSSDNLAVMSPAAASIKSPARPPSAHHNASGFVRRLSISSRRSSFSRERDAPEPTPMSPATVFSDGSEDDKAGSDKKTKKRASRFMRRLSNSFGGGRKPVAAHISPTVAEEDPEQLTKISAAMESHVAAASPAIIAYMGDVNVQFPDNLLWKRRSMCLDAQGFLFLSDVQGVTNGKEKTGSHVKRYHISDFRTPYIPDVEVQELPNSVVLDLVEGSCLQFACEDRTGQKHVLDSK